MTEKPRFTITVTDAMLEAIEQFQQKNNFATRSGAIQQLIKLGILDLQKSGEIKNAPLESEARPELYQIETQSFPLLGNIACGEPVFAEEHFEAYVKAGTRINADFCLQAEGDSMIGARIYDGDIVFIHKQDMVDNGEIAAVLIGDEATLKRVDYDRERGELTLYPENPRYRPLRLRGEELEDVRILGKAVAALADLE